MNRTTDEQIAEWRKEHPREFDAEYAGRCVSCSMGWTGEEACDAEAILDALEAERARADAAEAHLNEDITDWIERGLRLGYAKRAVQVLWASRRMWQEEAKKYHRFFLGYVRISERQDALIAKVRELRRKEGEYALSNLHGDPIREVCEYCTGRDGPGVRWPCETIRIIDGTDSPDDKGSTSTAKG